ncbi:MAG: Mur ligase family protein, partial [Prevotella sp.]|nr:Mur ligase family protein [Prevotella sp.]
MNTKNLYDLYKQHPVITTDSRNCPEGSIFIALKGETFDGNKFAAQALASGCSYAVVDNSEYVEENDERYILVSDTLQTYKALAREHRRQFDIPVIGITGTNGKTTTKELIASVLRQKYNVLATEGNFNNDVGVPKTLFRMNKEHEIAIIEMGASHQGDIKTLAETAEPDYGIITNVGLAHLQGFGSLKGVIRTKGELYKFLASKEDSTVFINADNNYLLEILPDNVWVTPYSTNKDNEEDCIIGEVVSCEPYLTMRWHEPLNELSERGEEMTWHEVRTQLIGRYNIDNVLAAVAVGINFGVEPKKICKAL